MKCNQVWVSRQTYYKQRIRGGSLTNSSKNPTFLFNATMHLLQPSTHCAVHCIKVN